MLDFTESGKSRNDNYDDRSLGDYNGNSYGNAKNFKNNFGGYSKKKGKNGYNNKRGKKNKKRPKGENKDIGYGQFNDYVNSYGMSKKNSHNWNNNQYRVGENNRFGDDGYQNWSSNDRSHSDGYNRKTRNTIENMTVDELDQRIKKKVKKQLQKWNDKNDDE